MADQKISDMAVATLVGTELMEVVQGGVNKQTTPNAIAALASGGVSSVNGRTGAVTGVQDLVNSATALTDAASMDLTAIKHTLTTSSATRTFTISYTGDDITIEITLNTTACTLTFPATTLCRYEGNPSGDNTMPLAGASGDKHIIAVKKVGSNYYAAGANFGQ